MNRWLLPALVLLVLSLPSKGGNLSLGELDITAAETRAEGGDFVARVTTSPVNAATAEGGSFAIDGPGAVATEVIFSSGFEETP